MLEYKFLHLFLSAGGIVKTFNDVPQFSVCCLTGEDCGKTQKLIRPHKAASSCIRGAFCL